MNKLYRVEASIEYEQKSDGSLPLGSIDLGVHNGQQCAAMVVMS